MSKEALEVARLECARLNAEIDWEAEFEHLGAIGNIQLFDKP